jgi:hypothetical protein
MQNKRLGRGLVSSFAANVLGKMATDKKAEASRQLSNGRIMVTTT